MDQLAEEGHAPLQLARHQAAARAAPVKRWLGDWCFHRRLDRLRFWFWQGLRFKRKGFSVG